MSDLPTILYIAGIGHSGTTLLTLLLSAHSQIATIGEIKALSSLSTQALQARLVMPCTCGASDKNACAFWQQLDSLLQARFQLSLAALDVRSPVPDTFRQHNQAVFASIRALTGALFLVDSSKDLRRLRPLMADGTFRVRPILIERSAHGVVYSEMKKGRPWPHHAAKWYRQMTALGRALAHHDHYHLRYEALARHPRRTLMGLMQWLQIPFEESQLAWASQKAHIIAGNQMSFGDESTIRLDEAWRRQLTLRQKVGIAWMSSPLFPYTVGLRHLFRLWPSRWREEP